MCYDKSFTWVDLTALTISFSRHRYEIIFFFFYQWSFVESQGEPLMFLLSQPQPLTPDLSLLNLWPPTDAAPGEKRVTKRSMLGSRIQRDEKGISELLPYYICVCFGVYCLCVCVCTYQTVMHVCMKGNKKKTPQRSWVGWECMSYYNNTVWALMCVHSAVLSCLCIKADRTC